MATRTVRIDDFDGKSEDAEGIIFGAAGEFYEIDLSAANLKKLTDAIQPFVDKARQISARDALKTSNGNGDYDPAVLRAWALRNGKTVNGKPVGEKGRIPAEIVEDWRKATQP